jgi:hypothetical protein
MAFVVRLVQLGVGLGLQQLCKLYPFTKSPLLCMGAGETHSCYAVQSNPPNVLVTGNDHGSMLHGTHHSSNHQQAADQTRSGCGAHVRYGVDSVIRGQRCVKVGRAFAKGYTAAPIPAYQPSQRDDVPLPQIADASTVQLLKN